MENPATLAEIEAELEKYRGKSFVFTSWGGALQAAQRQAWLVPFQKKFGIEIIEDSPVSYPRVRAMAETGNIQWHVLDASAGSGIPIGKAGDLEELDFSIIDNRDYIETLRRLPWSGGGGYTWATVVASSTAAAGYPTLMMAASMARSRRADADSVKVR